MSRKKKRTVIGDRVFVQSGPSVEIGRSLIRRYWEYGQSKVHVRARAANPPASWPRDPSGEPAWVYIELDGVSWGEAPVPPERYTHRAPSSDGVKERFAAAYADLELTFHVDWLPKEDE